MCQNYYTMMAEGHEVSTMIFLGQPSKCDVVTFSSCTYASWLANQPIAEFRTWEQREDKVVHVANMRFEGLKFGAAKCSMNGEMRPCWGTVSFSFEKQEDIVVENGEEIDAKSTEEFFEYIREKGKETQSSFDAQQDLMLISKN